PTRRRGPGCPPSRSARTHPPEAPAPTAHRAGRGMDDVASATTTRVTIPRVSSASRSRTRPAAGPTSPSTRAERASAGSPCRSRRRSPFSCRAGGVLAGPRSIASRSATRRTSSRRARAENPSHEPAPSGPLSGGTVIRFRSPEGRMATGLDRAKAEQFLEQVVSDVGTALLGALSFIGDRLGLFRTLADTGPVTIEALATRTGLSARYLREWLNAMTAAGYIPYRPESGQYVLPPEHATVVADPESPFFVGGFLELVVPSVSQAPKLLSAFRDGRGVSQRDYPPEMFEAIERGTAPWYKHHLLQDWIPAMPQVGAVLSRGGRAADVGCGSGQAAIALARGFPEARIVGYDIHEGSIARARANAAAAGLAGRVAFEIADASRLPERHFDFISTF